MKTAGESVLNHVVSGKKPAASGQKCPAGCLSLKKGAARRPEPPVARIEDEMTELLRQHAAALSRYGMTLARDRTIVQDGIQEAFLRYFIARIGGQQMENPRAWLFRVFGNYVLDCKRRSKSRPAVDLDAAMQVADLRQDIEAGYQQSETFRRALCSLSPREQQCMQLRLEGFGYDEIAKILRIRTGTVGALLARGLKKIHETGLFSGRQRRLDRSSGE
jgi:RNA polymerase sigma-70 factor (ECF subfamily)